MALVQSYKFSDVAKSLNVHQGKNWLTNTKGYGMLLINAVLQQRPSFYGSAWRSLKKRLNF